LKLTPRRPDPPRTITRVMCDLELDSPPSASEWGIAFSDYFADALAELRPLADDGLVDSRLDRVIASPQRAPVPAQHRHVLRRVT
jgi:hypothetical protein